MCIRDRSAAAPHWLEGLSRLGGGKLQAFLLRGGGHDADSHAYVCLLYTSDAADERSSVDLGGRRIIKKKEQKKKKKQQITKKKHTITNKVNKKLATTWAQSQ